MLSVPPLRGFGAARVARMPSGLGRGRGFPGSGGWQGHYAVGNTNARAQTGLLRATGSRTEAYD